MKNPVSFLALMLFLALVAGAGFFFLLAWILFELGVERYYPWAALIMMVGSLITGMSR